MQNALLNLLSNATIDGADATAGSKRVAGQAPKDAFLGFLRTFVAAGRQGAERPSCETARPKPTPRQSLPPRRQEALERIAVLADDGSLPSDQLMSLDEDDWQELETWVVDGAGGLFPPVPPDGEDLVNPQTEVELDTATAAGRAEPLSEQLAEMLNAALASQPETGVEAAQGEARLAQAFALDSLTSEERQTLLQALAAALAQALRADGVDAADAVSEEAPQLEGDGKVELVLQVLKEQLADLPVETLRAALQQAGAQAEVGPLADSELLASLPEVVVRALAVQVVDVGVSADQQTGMALLAALAHSNTLAERLAGTEGAAQSETASAGEAEVDAPGLLLADVETQTPGEGGSDDQQAAAEAKAELVAGKEKAQSETQPVPTPAGGAPVQPHEHERAESVHVEKKPVAGESAPLPVAETINKTTDSSASRVAAETLEHLPVKGVDPVGAPTSEVNGPREATPTTESEASRAVMLAENVERVEQAMRLSLQRNMTHVSLQLSPPELGRVTLRVRLSHGVVSATVHTENTEARQLLSSGVQQLRQNLQVQGIELDAFDVHLGGQGLHEGQDGGWARQGRSRGRGRRGEADGDLSPAAAIETESAPGTPSADGSLNIVV